MSSDLRLSSAPQPGPVADAVRGHWVDRHMPARFRPYARLMRLERPIGWWLLLWPCWWSATLAAGAAGRSHPDPWHMALFLVGAVVMRGAGCVYNDILDRDIDGAVERTRLRPIPSGQVSVRQAAVFMLTLALAGFGVLVQFNGFTIGLGLASLGIVAVYPLMKRVTDWPQFVLGLAFSWGALLGWTAVFGRLDWAPVLTYLASIVWTIGYDTIYAHQDKEDDEVVGVRSTARLFAGATAAWLTGLYGATVVLLAGALALAGAGLVAYVGLAGLAMHLAWQVARLDITDAERCLRLFRSNREAGAILFAGLVADVALRALMAG